MKRRKWLSLLLAAALVISMVPQQEIKASPAENVSETETDETKIFSEETNGENTVPGNEETDQVIPDLTAEDASQDLVMQDEAVLDTGTPKEMISVPSVPDNTPPAIPEAPVLEEDNTESEPSSADQNPEDSDEGASVMSILPLPERNVSLYLNDYTEEQLKVMPVDTILDILNQTKDSKGNQVVIPADAEVLCGYQKDEYGDTLTTDSFKKMERGGTIDLSGAWNEETSYFMQLIVGSANQLDADNVRYLVRVYINNIEEDLSYRVYTKEDANNSYRQYVQAERILAHDSSRLGNINVPVTEVSYYVKDDTPYQTGDTCCFSIYSELALHTERNIAVDVYPMQNYLTYLNGGNLTGEITGQILNQDIYQSGGFEGTYMEPDISNPLASSNVFCVVYSEKDTGNIIAAQGLIFIIRSDTPPDVNGKILTYEDNQMKEAAELTYSSSNHSSQDAEWSVDQAGTVIVKYYTIHQEYQLLEGYSYDKDYYFALDENEQIQKVVLGNYDTLEEAVRADAEDITEQIMPGSGAAVPFGYKMEDTAYTEFTVYFKNGIISKYRVLVWSRSDDSDYSHNNYTSMQITGAKGHDRYTDAYIVDGDVDTYYKNGYQTILINDTGVDLKNLVPTFITSGDNVRVYVGTEQKSGESVQDFSNGPVQYTAFINDNPKNYQVTFVKKEDTAKLFVNGPDEREIFLSNLNDYRQHDILIANVGAQELTGLKVELQNASHVKLDDYWTVGGEKNNTLAAFDTIEKKDANGQYVYYGELPNLAKIRLLPDGKGEISGTLKISADGQEDVFIKLRGYAGNPEITTESLSNGVKYVPYSFVVSTNSMYDWNKVTFSISSGELPEGVSLDPDTGEIYGVPREAGEFPIRVRASYSRREFSGSSASFVLTIEENTDDNVYGTSDPGYEIKEHIGTQRSDAEYGTYHYVLTERGDQLFVSTGVIEEFVGFWLNGEKLVEGEDYTKESGSTRITIRRQTFENKANQEGANTIAAEFRVDGERNNDLKRTAQNFQIDFQSSESSRTHSSGNSGESSGGGSAGTGGGNEGSLVTLVMHLVDAGGNALQGLTVELHSTPKTAKTNQKGIAVFYGVESGWHTLYVKDAVGNLLASRSFELVFGDEMSVNGSQIIVKAGMPSTLEIQLNGNELNFQNLQAGDPYQVLPAGTGDESNPEIWLLLSVLCVIILVCAFYGKRKNRV